jgi:uncharacterized phiE125 gp8 family phage protein
MSLWNLKSGSVDNLSYSTPRQNIKLVRVTAPTLSIVSRTEAKNYLKIGSDTTDDSLVDDLIKASTSIIERECGGIAICEQTWKQYQKGGVETIELMRQPVIGTPTVSDYEDFDTVTATNITVTSYFRTIENELVHVDGFFEEGRDLDGYTITYKAGKYTASSYTSSDDPDLGVLKTAILRTMAWLYEQREEHVTKIGEDNWNVTYDGNLPMGIKRLIMPMHTGKGLI